MSTSTDARRKEVLRAIVADYIASQEPVGSKSLLERYQLGVSSATIRNDMAVLESQGLISQQHASSGRVPTQQGYRHFVDSLHEVKPLSAPERRAMLNFLEGGVDLEDVLRRSVQLLAQVTKQAAVVQLPNLKVSRVKHCEVVALSQCACCWCLSPITAAWTSAMWSSMKSSTKTKPSACATSSIARWWARRLATPP